MGTRENKVKTDDKLKSERLKQENLSFKEKLNAGSDDITPATFTNDEKAKHYTGLRYVVLMSLFTFLEPHIKKFSFEISEDDVEKEERNWQNFQDIGSGNSRCSREKEKDVYQALEISNYNKEAYKDLCEVALTQIILFNRRRQGEVSQKKIEDCQSIQKKINNDVQDSLSGLEKELCKALTRVEIMGKHGRTVPVILTEIMKKWLDLLVQTRQKAGVAEDNKLAFARSGYGSLGHMRGSDCRRKLSDECGTKQPNFLRSTN
ncbi:unnamed protein product [Mytilus coruscus]|uniref:Uncharacterized protein n=1 Tax=Mytilus coruscus TaxID=42192 RepID=A0A6J8AB49_MYTCO|nr:unnamed protein product [Mytilus coruscus]